MFTTEPASWPKNEEASERLAAISYMPSDDIFVIKEAGGEILDYSGDKAQEILLQNALKVLGAIDPADFRDCGPPLPPPPLAELDLSGLEAEGSF